MISGLALEKFTNKKLNARRDGIEFLLTIEQYDFLLKKANITIEQVGRGRGKFCLGRYGDVGPYSLENCRFITQEENLKEQSTNVHRPNALKKISQYQRSITKENSESRRSQSRKISRSFLVTSPNGETFHGTNLKEFCHDKGLCDVNMGQVCLGKSNHYKGWTGFYTDKGQFK